MPSYRYQWKKIYTTNNFSKLLQHMFLYKFCRKYYKFSLPDRKPDSPNRLWTRDETRRAANDVNDRHIYEEIRYSYCGLIDDIYASPSLKITSTLFVLYLFLYPIWVTFILNIHEYSWIFQKLNIPEFFENKPEYNCCFLTDKYRISANNFRKIYSFLDFEIVANSNR